MLRSVGRTVRITGLFVLGLCVLPGCEGYKTSIFQANQAVKAPIPPGAYLGGDLKEWQAGDRKPLTVAAGENEHEIVVTFTETERYRVRFFSLDGRVYGEANMVGGTSSLYLVEVETVGPHFVINILIPDYTYRLHKHNALVELEGQGHPISQVDGALDNSKLTPLETLRLLRDDSGLGPVVIKPAPLEKD